MTATALAAPAEKPASLEVLRDNIPRELKLREQWVVWDFECRDGKYTKLPYGSEAPKRKYYAQANKPDSWLPFPPALSWYRGHGFSGIGFVFSADDPYFGIDLDKCRNPETGEIEPAALEIIRLFNTYTEVSPSGTGVKLWGRGKLPIGDDETGRRVGIEWSPGHAGQIECYDRNRYFAMTGHVLPEGPTTIRDCSDVLDDWFKRTLPEKEKPAAAAVSASPCTAASMNGHGPTDHQILERMFSSRNGDKLQRLFNGDVSGYTSHSEADLALLSGLAFFVGPDTERIKSLFRQSGLNREKFDREDYSTDTVNKALSGKTDFYDWSPPLRIVNAAKGRSSKAAGAAPELPPTKINDRYALQPISERQTDSGKVTVQVRLFDKGVPVSLLEITSAGSNQEKAAKVIGRYLSATVGDAAAGIPSDDTIDVPGIVGRLVCDAQERLAQALSAPVADAGETIREIITRVVPEAFDFRWRTADGRLWSEKRSRAVSRQEFIAYTPAPLVDAAAAGRDSPVNDVSGEADEVKLVRIIQNSLGVLWATLMETLPVQAADAADLGAETAAAQKFVADVFRAWTSPVLFKNVSVGRDGDETGVTRASLASLVSDLFRPFDEGRAMIEGRQRWLEIRTSIPAWFRPHIDNDGMIVPALAMRYDLFDNLRIPCDWAADQESFRRLGGQCGAFTDSPPVRGRLTDGTRLAVLSAKLTQRILAKPIELTADDDEDGDQPDLADAADATDGNSAVRE